MHGTFTKIDHNLGHKTDLNKFKRIEVIQNTMFTYHKETNQMPLTERDEK